MTRKLSPRLYCIECSYEYGMTDEICESCGFDPVDNEQDAEWQAMAEREWDLLNHV